MKICLYGAGATGGHLAVRLALAGHEVSVVARGEHLAAIRAQGLELRMGDRRLRARCHASDRPADLGPQQLVISTLKSTALGSLARDVAPLLAPDTPVVFAQNGIPWWYPGAPASLDVDGALARAVPRARVLGGVIQSSNIVLAPGVVQNDTPDANQLLVAEPDADSGERVAGIRAVLESAGIGSPAVADLRRAIWTKLVVNLSVSTLGLLTGEPATIVARDDGVAEVCARLMREAIAIAASQGIALDERQYDGWRFSPPDHRPSILQDYELGRPMEIDSIIRAPQALARQAGVPTPTLDVVAALAAARARARGLLA